MKKNSTLFSMASAMFKIGAIGFGGGTALIPVIEHEVVEQSKIVTEEEFNRDVMIASITPGALPVEVATGIGRETAGNRGMIAAATAMALPGAFLTLFLLVLFSGMSDTMRTQIGFLSAGISVFIIYLLAQYVFHTLKQAKDKKEALLYFCMMISVFAVSGEKNIYQLLHLSATPIFSLSVVQVLGSAFFVILFTQGQLRMLRRSIPALGITLIYYLCAGNAHILPSSWTPFITLAMAALAIHGFYQTVAKAKHQMKFPLKKLSGSIASWLLFTFILSLPAIFLTLDALPFLGDGFLSSVMSFGGGDAYLSVAQGMFVESGQIRHADFYGNIVTVANALPGSILCKILTGVGYYLGYGISHSVLDGIWMAVCGFACSVAASGMIYTLVWAIYEKYENLRIFAAIKHFIRPIISGLLVNVALSLYISAIREPIQSGHPSILTLIVTFLVVAGIFYMSRKQKH